NKLRRQVREHGHAAKMIFESAAAVGFVELRAEGSVLEHDVENVAEHFVGDDIELRDDRGGARIEIHASHFAEQVARAQVRDKVAIRKVHGSIDGDDAIARFFLAFVMVATNQRAGQPLEKTFGASLRPDVCNRRGNGNSRAALDDVKRRRAKFTFAANHFAFAEAAFDDGTAIQRQENSGNVLEDGNL